MRKALSHPDRGSRGGYINPWRPLHERRTAAESNSYTRNFKHVARFSHSKTTNLGPKPCVGRGVQERGEEAKTHASMSCLRLRSALLGQKASDDSRTHRQVTSAALACWRIHKKSWSAGRAKVGTETGRTTAIDLIVAACRNGLTTYNCRWLLTFYFERAFSRVKTGSVVLYQW